MRRGPISIVPIPGIPAVASTLARPTSSSTSSKAPLLSAEPLGSPGNFRIRVRSHHSPASAVMMAIKQTQPRLPAPHRVNPCIGSSEPRTMAAPFHRISPRAAGRDRQAADLGGVRCPTLGLQLRNCGHNISACGNPPVALEFSEPGPPGRTGKVSQSLPLSS